MFLSGIPHFPQIPQKKGLICVAESGSKVWERSGLEWNLSTTTPNIFQCWEASGLCLDFLVAGGFAVLVNILKNQSNNMRIFRYVFLYGGCWVVDVKNSYFCEGG